MEMIKYDRLWITMKEKGITQYDLYTRYNVNRSQLDRLRHNKNLQSYNTMITIQHCSLQNMK